MDGATQPEDEYDSPSAGQDGQRQNGRRRDRGQTPNQGPQDTHGDCDGLEDLNLLLLRGRVVAEPEIREFSSGVAMIRYLATVTTPEPRRRLDVIPISYWDPPEALLRRPGRVRNRICVLGTVQRRFWPQRTGGVRSRIEVVASEVHVRSG